MSVNTSNFNIKSVCVTCLSQNRKLYTLNESQTFAKLYSELSLAWTDKICWECYNMMKKMVTFTIKVQKAQAWLRSVTNGQQHEILCLTSLRTSSSESISITDPGLITSADHLPIDISIKKEVKDDVFDDNIETPFSNDDRTIIEIEFSNTQSVNVDGANIKNEVNTQNTADMKLGKEKNTEKFIEVEVEGPSNKNAPVTPTSDNIYTETALTEEEMLAWRGTKRDTIYSFNLSYVPYPAVLCEMCVQPFETALKASAHAKKHTELYGDLECHICQQRALDDRQLEFHRRQHYRLLKCRYCEFSWDNVNTMRQHCSDVHQIKQTLWDCEDCTRQFPSYNKMAVHVKGHRHVNCPECQLLLAKNSLQNHMLLHSGGNPVLECAECGARVRGAAGLRAHRKTHNREVDPAAFCTECNLQFRNKVTYKIHLKDSKVHAKESDFRFQCDKCGMKFTQLSSLQKHSVVHNEARPLFKCDQCDKSFMSQRSLTKHKQTHEGKQLRNYLCNYCGKGFSIKNILASHINTHTGARPFVCKLCGADFGHRSALYLHGRYKHKIQKKNDRKTHKSKNTEKVTAK